MVQPRPNPQPPAAEDKDLKVHAWVLAGRGVLAFVLGIAALARPSMAVQVLAALLGVFLLADGALRLLDSAGRAEGGRRWGDQALGGVLAMAAGLAILVRPNPAGLGLSLLAWIALALWALATGLLELRAARRLRPSLGRLSAMTLGGLLGTALGAWMLVRAFTSPAEATLPVVGSFIGTYALASGALLVLLAVRLHRLALRNRPPAARPA